MRRIAARDRKDRPTIAGLDAIHRRSRWMRARGASIR